MDNKTRNAWIDMISKVYVNLHNNQRVLNSSNKSDKKRERIIKYFNRLEEVHNKVSKTKSASAEKILKNFYYDLYIIKPENIPESYFNNQIELARERGYGNIILSDKDKERMIKQVIDDQKETLDKWIEYFLYDEESRLKKQISDKKFECKYGFKSDHSIDEIGLLDLAYNLPMSKNIRPQWDIENLHKFGFNVIAVDSNINSLVWDEMEQLKYEATPMFMVVAGK